MSMRTELDFVQNYREIWYNQLNIQHYSTEEARHDSPIATNAFNSVSILVSTF